jgi:chitinase
VLTFAPGETMKTVTVQVLGDTAIEDDESFSLGLSAASNAAIARAAGTATIRNDDSPALSIGDVTVAEGNSGATSAVFAVSLSPPAPFPVSVSYATANGTAKAGTDFTALTGSLTFAPGQTRKTIAVGVAGDTRVEPTETFGVALSGASGATIARGTGLATITNDDTGPLPTLSIGDASVAEGDSGTRTAAFTVALKPASPSAVTAGYATSDGTARSGLDYVARSGTLTFAPGDTRRTIAVPVTGDATAEPDETFTVSLSGAAGATIADGTGLGTIINDDAPPLPALSIDDVTRPEGDSGTTVARFAVTLSTPGRQAVTVAYATADGTATAGSDYVARSGNLTFAPGETRQTIDVVLDGDRTPEPTETFTVSLSDAAGATIARGTGQGTIGNDDDRGRPVKGGWW